MPVILWNNQSIANEFHRMLRDMKLLKNKKNIYILLMVMMLSYCVTSFSLKEIKKDKKFDSEIWSPWLSLDGNQIKSIKLYPVRITPYDTITNTVEITDRNLILEIKDNMNRKYMREVDKPGYHWPSKKHLRLTAITADKDFSFILLFHSRHPSVQYQMLKPALKKKYSVDCPGFHSVGEAWRSAELSRIITEYLENNNIEWVEVLRSQYN